MLTDGQLRIEPPADILDATRAWLRQVQPVLGHEFLAAYLTGSVLTQGFDPAHSRVNLLVVCRALDPDLLERLGSAIPTTRRAPHFEPLFVSRRQVEKSLDAFPIEWLEIQERHLRIEGEDVLGSLEVPRRFLRLQLEHELRGRHLRLGQTLLLSARQPRVLQETLSAAASGFATHCRTLLRLRGESPSAHTAQVIERVADLFSLDAQGLLAAHLVRYGGRRYKGDEIRALYKRFLVEVGRLVDAIDGLEA